MNALAERGSRWLNRLNLRKGRDRGESLLPSEEQGFALLGTMWLLLLSATLVALLMLHATSASKEIAAEADAVQRDFDLDAGIETAAASLLIEGPRSAWARLPGEASVSLEHGAVTISTTGERGRLDLNEAEPTIIDAVLREARYSALSRAAFLTSLAARRAMGPIGTQAELDALAAPLLVGLGNSICPADLLTLESRLRAPDADQADALVRRALAVPLDAQPVLAKPGEAIRIRASAGGGASETRVIRVGLIGAASLVVSRGWIGEACAGK